MELSVAAAAPAERYIGRQPVLRADGSLFGYELFVRAGGASCHSEDPETAMRELIDHWLTLIPGHRSQAGFLRCTRSALTEGLVALLPPASTVLEIPAGLSLDSDLMGACVRLRHTGYRFAFDGLVPGDARATAVDLADFLKIDFSSFSFQQREAIYALGRGGSRQFVAQQIDSEYHRRVAVSEGCLLLQGHFLSDPLLTSCARTVAGNHLIYVRLMGELHHSPLDLRRIERLIAGEPTLCYRLLRVANSALQGHASRVTSVREALLMVGDEALRRIAVVALARALPATRSAPLLSMVLTRARFSEQLAPLLHLDPARQFLLGVISLLDHLLGVSMTSLLEMLPIADAMKADLLGTGGLGGRVLELAAALEACDWEDCDRLQIFLRLPPGSIAPLYTEALQWASCMLEA